MNLIANKAEVNGWDIDFQSMEKQKNNHHIEHVLQVHLWSLCWSFDSWANRLCALVLGVFHKVRLRRGHSVELWLCVARLTGRTNGFGALVAVWCFEVVLCCRLVCEG